MGPSNRSENDDRGGRVIWGDLHQSALFRPPKPERAFDVLRIHSPTDQLEEEKEAKRPRQTSTTPKSNRGLEPVECDRLMGAPSVDALLEKKGVPRRFPNANSGNQDHIHPRKHSSPPIGATKAYCQLGSALGLSFSCLMANTGLRFRDRRPKEHTATQHKRILQPYLRACPWPAHQEYEGFLLDILGRKAFRLKVHFLLTSPAGGRHKRGQASRAPQRGCAVCTRQPSRLERRKTKSILLAAAGVSTVPLFLKHFLSLDNLIYRINRDWVSSMSSFEVGGPWRFWVWIRRSCM